MTNEKWQRILKFCKIYEPTPIKPIVIPKFKDHNPLCPFTMYERTDFWYPSLYSALVASGGVTNENSETHCKHTLNSYGAVGRAVWYPHCDEYLFQVK